MSDDNKLRLLLGRLPGEPKKRPVPSGTLNPEYDKTTKKMVPFKTLNETQVQTLIGGHKATFPVCFDVSSSDFSLSHADFLKYVPPIIKFLDLSNNKLKSIPTELSRQENLKYLYCECNHLTSLSLSGLSNLRFVSLSHNRLTALNESFSELESVKYLDLSYNNIGADFDVLSKIKTLTVLDLSYNNITMTLPEFHSTVTLSLKGLPKLEYVAFEGNPVEETIPMFKYYIANELPKVKYLDWTQISKDDRTKGMTLDLSNTWKGKNDITARSKKIGKKPEGNPPEPAGAKKRVSRMVRSSTVSLAEPPTIVDDYKWKPSTHKNKDDSRTNPAFLLAKDRKNKEKRKSKKCDDNTNDAKSLSVDGERSEEVSTDSVKACPITNRNDNDCICTANDDDDDDEMPPPLRPAEHSNILPLTMSVLMDDKKQRHKRGKHIGKPKGTAQSTIDAEESNSEEQPLQQQQQPPEEEKKVGKKRSGGLKGKAESEGVAEGTTEKQVTTRISSDKASSETGELKPRKKKLMTRRKSNAEKSALMMSLLGEIDKMVLDYNKETPWCMGYLESEEFVSPTLKLEVPCLDDDGNNNSSGGSGKRASRVKKEGDKSELYSKEETTTTSTSTATTTTTVVKAKQEVNESAESLLLSLSLGSPRSRHGSNDIADIDIKDIDLSGIASRPHYTTSRESPHKKTSRSSSLSRSANGNISAEELLKELGRPRSISPGKIAVQNAGSGTAAAIPSPSVTATSERGDRQRPRTTVRAPPQIDGLSSSFPSESSGKRASGTRKYNMNNSQLLNCDSKELRIKKFQRLPNSSSSKSPGSGSNRDSDDNSSEERGSIRKDTRSSSSSSSSSSSKSKSKSRSRSSSGSIEAERRTERRAYNTTVTSNGDSERIIGEIVRKIKNILLVPVPKQDLPMTTKGVCAVENLVIDKGIFIDDEMLLEGLVTSVLLADSTKFADPRYVSLYEKVLKVLVVLLDRKKSTWGPISRGLCSKAKEAVLFLHIMYRNGRIYAMSLLLKMLFMAQKCAKKHGNHDLAGKIYENRGLVVLGVITKELCTEEVESEKANAAKAAVWTLQCISQMLRNKVTGNTAVEEFVSILDGESLCISVFKGFDMIHGNPNLTHYALKVVDTIIPDPLPNNEVHNSQQPASSSNNISGFICGPLIEELVDTLCTEKRERTAKIALNIFRKVLPYYPTTTAALDKLCCWLSQYPHFSLDVLRVLNFEHFACARKRNPSEMQSALVELNKKYAVLGLTADLFSEPKSELVCEALRFAAFFVESLQPGEYEGGVIAKAFFADGNIQAAKVVAMVHPRDHTPATRCALRLVDALMCYDVNMKVLIANIFARVSFVQNTLEKLLCVKEGKVVVKHALSITQGLATIPNNTGNDNEFWVKPILDNAKFFKRLTKLVLIPDDFDANYVALSTLVTLFHYRGSFEAFRTVDDSMLSMVQIINFNVSEGQDKGDSTDGKHQLANKYTLANIFLQEFYGHTKVPQEADELLNILTSIKTDAYADTEVTLAELFFALARDFLMMDEVKAPSSEQLKSKIVQIMIQLMKQSIVPGEERLTDNVKMLLKESGIVSAFKHLAETSRNATIKSVATKIVPTLAKYIQ